ncbi:DUF4184 family protein [Paenibacillus chibensis]|uniref:DUF4184 family protein n=1 Tax=Paenibacillus chibensis TaxID=59846 RepID=UPI0013E38212|nr:DUF4184 family protein [Paenibacillus chibensis]MEC0368616.1 DUF4184 family protein [Paenibacillus chibensis]
MPFTFAHPIYIAPAQIIKPKYLSFTGLVLGSMAPDFEYFIALEPYQRIGHTHWGLLLEAFPLSVVMILLLQIVMRSFALHLPSLFDLDARAYGLLRSFDYRRLRSWIVFLVSVAIGFYSHIVLDAFTHQSGYAVMRLPALQNLLWGLPVYKLMQYFLSMFGVMAELLIILRIVSQASVPAGFLRIPFKRKRLYWICVIAAVAGVTAVKLAVTSSANTLGIVVVAPISGLVLGIAAAGVIFLKALDP